MAWTVVFFRGTNGEDPITQFLRGELSDKQRARASRAMELLEEFSVNLGYPYSSQVRGKIRELRTQAGDTKLRFLYAPVQSQRMLILVGIIKDSAKIPEKALEMAQKRLLDWERQNS